MGFGAPKQQTTKTEPWDGAQPYLKNIYAQYGDLLAQGAPKQWAGDTVAGLSDATKTSQAQQINYAKNAANSTSLTNARNATDQITRGTNFNPQAANTLAAGTKYTNPGVEATWNAMRGIDTNYTNPAAAQAANANGYTNSALDFQQAQAGQLSTANNPAMANLRATAAGENVGNNPYLNAAVNTQTQKIADQLGNMTMPTLQAQAAGVGRMGSNASASLLNNATSTAAEAMSKVATDMYANQYNTDTQRMLDANNQYGNFYNTDTANAMNAYQALSNTSNTQQGQRLAGTELYGNLMNSQQGLRNDANNLMMQGAGQLGSLHAQQQDLRNSAATGLAGVDAQKAQTQLQAAGMAGEQYMNGLLPSQVLGQVGQTQDERAQSVLTNQVQRYEQQQQQQLMNLANYANLLNGGGYSNQTSPVYSSGAAQGLGLFTALLGLL